MTPHAHLPFEDNLVVTPLQEVRQPTGASYYHTAYLCEGGMVRKVSPSEMRTSEANLTSLCIFDLSFWLKGL